MIDTRAGKGPIETDHAEDIAYSNQWSGDVDATVTDEGARPNSFTHRLHVGTLAGNYEITAVFGTLTVTAAPPCRVALDALGGRIGSAVAVTQAVRTIYGALPEATRGGYRFAGWFLGVTNGAPEAVAGGDVLAPGDHALFAKWICDPEAVPDPEAVYTWEALGAGTSRAGSSCAQPLRGVAGRGRVFLSTETFSRFRNIWYGTADGGRAILPPVMNKNRFNNLWWRNLALKAW